MVQVEELGPAGSLAGPGARQSVQACLIELNGAKSRVPGVLVMDVPHPREKQSQDQDRQSEPKGDMRPAQEGGQRQQHDGEKNPQVAHAQMGSIKRLGTPSPLRQARLVFRIWVHYWLGARSKTRTFVGADVRRL